MNIYYLTVFVSEESGNNFTGWFQLNVSHKTTIRLSARTMAV